MKISEINGRFPYLLDIPEDEYHRAAREGEYVGSHQLADFRMCPLLYRKKVLGEIERADSPALAFGRALHKFVLEGQDAFNEEYVVNAGPVNPKTGEPFGRLTKAYRSWAAVQTARIVSPEDYETMRKMRDSVRAHEGAMDILECGVAEAVVRAKSCGIPLQARMDWFNPYAGDGRQAIVDLKTCENLDCFESDAIRFGYPQQLEFYSHVLFCVQDAVLDGEPGPATDLYLIGVEKREPFRTGVWRLSDDLVSQASCSNMRSLSRLESCRRSGVWPTDYEDVRILGAK
ncbi:MAG: PD-(D/E)XK nuclease-like domain-containing protein [Kiritimatiellae bacterium]|nr:PD-(D/E)XK nuclease-like domain-containing protein [Kiritimatiellia bacterium]